MRFLILGAAAALLFAPGAARAQAPADEHAIVVPANSETWMPAPAVLPAGARLAVVEGDPSKPGTYTMRLWMPDGYRIPPHFHSSPEHVTVLKGTFLVGMGDHFDASKLSSLAPGSFGMIPPGMHHFAQAQGEVVIQLHGSGPWTLTYVNPADAPSGTHN
jgi:mannose-6-phosphate isomerase-like protein (cupin superfamily)